MARPKKVPQNDPLQVVSVKLTPASARFLRQLSQEASDRLGWTVSSSTIVRALVAFAVQQPASWAIATLLPEIEREIVAGRVWGSKKRTQR